ncbi:MAG: hypothetical protein ACYDD6_10315, partial [Acidimicrobiales bacterium]
MQDTMGTAQGREPGKIETMWRRYFPIGIGAACLAMFVGFFPSTAPAGTSGVLAPPAPGISPSFAAARGTPPGLTGAVAAPAGMSPYAATSPDSGLFSLSSAPSYFAPPYSPPSVDQSTPPAGSGPPAPSAPAAASCPVAPPSTGTPLDALLSELSSLCLALVTQAAGVPSVPGAAGTS